MIESWWMDLKYSARRLASRPAYMWLAVLTLALGAGGTAAVVSVIRPILLEPLPYAREEGLGVFWMGGDWTEQEFLHLRPDWQGFQSVATYNQTETTLDTPGEPLRLLKVVVSSAELFQVLGAHPSMGRVFQPGDDLQGSEPVVVLSHGMWRELGGNASVLGRTLQIGGVARTVVGVMPQGFWFPDPAVRVWLPESLSPQARSGNYALVGRVAPGQVATAMAGPLAALRKILDDRFDYPVQWDKTKAPAVTPIREAFVGPLRPALVAVGQLQPR